MSSKQTRLLAFLQPKSVCLLIAGFEPAVESVDTLSQTHSGMPLLQGIPPEPQVIFGIFPFFEVILDRKTSKCVVKGRGFPFKDSRAVSSALRENILGLCAYCIAEKMSSLFRGNFASSNQPHQGLWRASLLPLHLLLVVTNSQPLLACEEATKI